jgi:predicted transcriptional regulator
MAQAVPMRNVWEARKLIMRGLSVKETALACKMTEASVRNYTKSERAKMKEREKVAR